jgi:hypothetical protein
LKARPVLVCCRCKRLNGLGRHDMVFAKASPASLAVKASAWSEPAQRFLKRCADAGNLEACYILGMVRRVTTTLASFRHVWCGVQLVDEWFVDTQRMRDELTGGGLFFSASVCCRFGSTAWAAGAAARRCWRGRRWAGTRRRSTRWR